MKMNQLMEDVLSYIESKNLIPKNMPYNLIQTNLRNCTEVVEHILKLLYKDIVYKVDVSEYFNLLIIRFNVSKFDFELYKEYIDVCKKFKEIFTECGIEINIALFLGDINNNEYSSSAII